MLKIVVGLLLTGLAASVGAEAKGGVAPMPVATVLAHPVYVIRHLQKGTGDDPPLTAEGAAYAQQLAQHLAGSKIKAVFATATRRAQQTGAPTAARMGVTVTTYHPGDGAGLKAAVTAVGGPVLIVGHSNTVPEIVAAFGGQKPAAIADDQYGTLYLVEPGKSDVRQFSLAAGERG